MKSRRKHQPEFKARIALEALKGIKTTAEIAKAHSLHPVLVGEWKKALQDRSAELFSRAAGTDHAEGISAELERAQATIGSLTMDLEYLKKKSAALGLVIAPDSLKSRTLA
jgi:transposase